MDTTVAARTSRSRLGKHKQLIRSALGVAAFALASSVLATPGPAALRPPNATLPDRGPVQVVVVALDGARFREIFSGVDPELARRAGTGLALESAAQLMPNLHRLMSVDGAALGAPEHGAPISASGPDFVSLPGYSEIFTGRRTTGCGNNSCQGTSALSIVDELAEAPQRARKSAVITSWPDIAKVAAKSPRVAVSAGKHAGTTRWRLEREGALGSAVRRGESEPPWPGHGDFRRDRYTAELALAYLRAEQPSFLFVGLGETDEFAHQGNYAGYLAALHEADRYIGELSAVLAASARAGVRTALFVTADHGRAATFRDHGQPYPESARVWLVASGSAVEARGFVAAKAARHLADIAPTVRTLFGLPADRHQSAGFPLFELLGRAHK